ncbi:MAG: type II secretion system F family protein [Pseudomonadota bacterium]
MSAYQYVAYDQSGARVKGVLVADGEAHARALLTQEGLFPEKVTETRARPQRQRIGTWRKAALSPEDLAIFTRQISVLFAARIPVDEALQALMTGQAGGQINHVAAELQAHVRDGLPLSAAMGRLPGAFPDYYRAAIAAGENSSELEKICDVLAEFIEGRLTLRDQAVNSLFYPLFVGVVSLIVAAILLINVVPEVALLFEQTGQPLPALTRGSIALGDFLAAQWPVLAVALLVIGGGVRAIFTLPGPRFAYHRAVLRLPLLGPLARLKGAVLYLRTLHLVLAANMPAVQAMTYAAQAIDNLKLRADAAGSTQMVEEGQRLAAAIRSVPGLPAIALQMLDSGEKSGRLAEMAERAAQLVEFNLASRAQRLASLLEPVLMMVVGGMVLTIVLSVLLPIFELQTSFVN